MNNRSNQFVFIGRKPLIFFFMHYAFTAPKVKPVMMYFCTKTRKISAGNMDTTATAAIVPHSVPVVVTNSDRPVGIVLAYTLDKVAASKYSFHANKKLNKAVTAIPGEAVSYTHLTLPTKA